jgi:hypothetical protein
LVGNSDYEATSVAIKIAILTELGKSWDNESGTNDQKVRLNLHPRGSIPTFDLHPKNNETKNNCTYLSFLDNIPKKSCKLLIFQGFKH